MQSSKETSTRITLLRRAQAGSDSPEWEEVLRCYEPFIRRTLVRMKIETSEVDDVCQQVLTRLWCQLKNYRHYEKRARFRTWLTALIRNVAINAYQKRKRAKRTGGMGTDLISKLTCQSSGLEQMIENEWQRHVIALGMKRIQEVFTGKAIEVFLRTQEGEPIERVAESLGITKQTAYVLKSRVKKRLVDEVIRIRESLEFPDAKQ